MKIKVEIQEFPQNYAVVFKPEEGEAVAVSFPAEYGSYEEFMGRMYATGRALSLCAARIRGY